MKKNSILCCKLQIAMAIVKLQVLERQMKRSSATGSKKYYLRSDDSKKYYLRSGDSKKKVSSSSTTAVASDKIIFGSFAYSKTTAAATSTTEKDYAKECKDYIERKQMEFLRLRPIWRELKKKEGNKGGVIIPEPKHHEDC